MHKLLIEIDSHDKAYLENLKRESGSDSRFLESKNLDGTEILRLVIENAPNYLALVISVISLLKKDRKNITIIIEGGQKLINPDADQAEKFLNKDDKDAPSK